MSERVKTVSEVIAEGIDLAEKSGMTMGINRAKVIALHLCECGYTIVAPASTITPALDAAIQDEIEHGPKDIAR
jgi:hypothetical protein